MSASEKRKENIAKLEKLAQEVLQLKNIHRQRRPIVIEFCGSPKAGKTSSINSLNIFLKRKPPVQKSWNWTAPGLYA